MTHDELLARIDELERFSEWTHYLGDNRYAQSIPHTQQVMLKALRAVVEMHCIDGFVGDTCLECQLPYPCPTIQAIEQELL